MNSAYFNKVRPTYIENWSAELAQVSIPQTKIRLTLPEARALGLANKKFGGWFATEKEDFDSSKMLARIAGKIESSLIKYPNGAFIRLGSRSAKDSVYANVHGLRIDDAKSALNTLTSDSRRVAFDLRLALKNEYQPHIFLREWLEIPKWSEFRCFMQNGELVGISQYDCKNLGSCGEIARNANRIETAIRAFFLKIKPFFQFENVVFDVLVKIDEKDIKPAAKITLLELNPFLPQTDACLFKSCERGNFDGSFRFL